MTYTPIDIKLFEIFADKTLSFGCKYTHKGTYHTYDSSNYRLKWHGDGYHLYVDALCNCPRDIVKLYNKFEDEGKVEILGHEPQLHNVFRVAKDRGICIEINDFPDGHYLFVHIPHVDGFHAPVLIKYNPTLSLLSQSDETKLAIIKIFE